MRPSDLPSNPDKWPHGVRARYALGCRCVECRRANSEYEKHRLKERKAGNWNGLVSAAEARAYMLELSRLGIGRRAFQKATGVGDTTLQEIRSGKKKQIRKQTADRILAVTIDALQPHALVPAAVTHALIGVLLNNGYTKTRIASLLGTQTLQLRAEKIIRRNADKVREMFQMEWSKLMGAQ